jgi:hypothetical protein
MKITSCVPLPGPGVLARYGSLVAVTDGQGPGPDPLLGVLADVSAASGDGRELVRVAARAALGVQGQPSWACAGVTADGGVAVLVHGHAVAIVRADGSPQVTLTASDSVIPVSRTFAGSSVSLELTVGEPAVPDPRCWLGSGAVRGSGIALTAAADGVAPAPIPPALAADRTAPERAAGADSGAGAGTPPPVLVDGVLCDRGHFTDPGAPACRHCGSAIGARPGKLQRRQRPPLGMLVLDDGTRITLDGNYVLGREPNLDGDVIAGRARPLRISDPGGSVSRLHLKIALVGWQVEVSDLGSANGSVVQSPGGERGLVPFEPAVVEPGAWISIGHRSIQYLASQGVLP